MSLQKEFCEFINSEALQINFKKLYYQIKNEGSYNAVAIEEAVYIIIYKVLQSKSKSQGEKIPNLNNMLGLLKHRDENKLNRFQLLSIIAELEEINNKIDNRQESIENLSHLYT